MKKAFTMLELVFVILIVGILSIAILPSFSRNSLQEAADQLISHIRYTQHLAMLDDKFDINDSKWYLARWTIRFQENVSFGGIPDDGAWTYTIYSDITNYTGHNPDLVGMALNPLVSNKYLSGGYDNTLSTSDAKASKELQLNEKYGISNVTFSGGCRSDTLFVSFDYLGRPFNSFPTDSSYELPAAGWHKLLTAACVITLTNGTKNIRISIEPETGYTHIL